MAQALNTSGYGIPNSPPPDAALVDAAKAEIQDRLPLFRDVTSDKHGYGMLGWGVKCEELFRAHADVRIHYDSRSISI